MPIVLGGVLVSVGVFATGAAAILVASARREAALARRRLLEPSVPEPAPETGAGSPEGVLAPLLGRIGERVSAGRLSDDLRRNLARAGFHGANAATAYLGAKLLLLLGGAVVLLPLLLLAGVAPSKAMLGAVAGATVLFFVPNAVVSQRRRRRHREIQRHLPDVVDLLEICVSSGMGLDTAWRSVTDEARRVSPPLADEMELTNLEMNLGVARAEAMRHMAERTEVEDINSLVALLVQSERFGASIVDAFRTFAESLREIRSRAAEEAAEKTTVKMLFPMVLCIFPAIMVVAVGPAMLSLLRVMRS